MTMHFPRDSAKVHPPSLFPYYKSTLKRAPKRPLMILPHTETELTGPAYGHEGVRPEDFDLHKGLVDIAFAQCPVRENGGWQLLL